jgi:SAM-dependent methyltransferase
MRLRLWLSKGIFKLSTALRYAILAILPPRDILQLAYEHYEHASKREHIEAEVEQGLNEFEEALLETVLTLPCDLLILGCGAGRESMAFAKRGFRVKGVDMIPGLVEYANAYAARHHLPATFECQDITELRFPPNSYDCAMYTLWLYGQLPSRALRVLALATLRTTLRAKGRLILHFHVSQPTPEERKIFFWLRVLAWITWGNREYQLGDRPVNPIGFRHPFASVDEVAAECREAGFDEVSLHLFEGGCDGLVVATAPASPTGPASCDSAPPPLATR